MTEDGENPENRAIVALLEPLARLMIESGMPLSGAVELMKFAFVKEGFRRNPKASVSEVSLVTGVHRKDVRRIDSHSLAPRKSISAARVISLWLNDPEFQENGKPRVLPRAGADGFDALVKRAKVDSAPSTLLSVLLESGCIKAEADQITLIETTLVPEDLAEKLQVAVATLRPHLDTAVGNIVGDRVQLDQALRYSHLSEAAAQTLEAEAARMSREMLQKLNTMAHKLQNEDDGTHLFVAGTFTCTKDQN